jgi:hypothetical protein
MLHLSKQLQTVTMTQFAIRRSSWKAAPRILSYSYGRNLSPFRRQQKATLSVHSLSTATNDSNSNNDKKLFTHDIVASTKKWVDSIVIRDQLCPFVEPLKAANSIRFVASNAVDIKQAVVDFATEAKLLLPDHSVTSTGKVDSDDEAEGLLVHVSNTESMKPRSSAATLISFHGPFVRTFEDFDVLCEAVYSNTMIDLKFFAVLSIKYFHPNFINYYEKRPEKADDSFFFAMRSPYPTMLLVPEVDMQSALDSDRIEELTLKNKYKCIEQGLDVCRDRLKSCYR